MCAGHHSSSEEISMSLDLIGTGLARRLGARQLFLVGLSALASFHQAARQPLPQGPTWQAAAGDKRAFEVASVKLDTGPFRPPNFPLDPGDPYRPVGGRFS